MTEYRDIPGFPGYRVGDDGSVWTCRVRGRSNEWHLGDTWRPLKQFRTNYGYAAVSLCPGRRIRLVHRLVLEAFLGPCPDGMEGCHNDGDKSNNALPNLRWDTRKANMADRVRHGTAVRGERQGSAKLTADQVREIRAAYRPGKVGHLRLAKRYGVCAATVRQIVTGAYWRHVPATDTPSTN